jgi:hypothetical protein
MAVDAVLKILDPSKPQMLDLRDIKVVTKVGGTIDDSELVEGMVFAQKAAKSAGGPQRVEKAQIGLIQVRWCAAFYACSFIFASPIMFICDCQFPSLIESMAA